MSTLAEEQSGPEGASPGPARLVLRILAGLVACASVFLLWSSERVRIAHDLQLVSEAVARPGETLAVRAIVLRDVEAPQGPTLARVPVTLELTDAQGRILRTTTLAPEVGDSMEGQIAIPSNAKNRLFLNARASLDDAPPLACRRAIEVSESAPTLAPHPREAGPLQQLVVGAVREHVVGRAPAPFLPRVSGGACVPEQPCGIVVWVGEPPSLVAAQPNPQVSIIPGSLAPEETSGLVALEVVPHGLDAHVTLEARQGGQLVAERQVRLPVALGEVGVAVRAPLLEPEGAPELALVLPPGRSHAIVDTFVLGRWRSSRTFESRSDTAAVKLAPELVPPGQMVRLQARVDPFSSDGAGTRLVYRREPGAGTEAALAQLAGLVSVATRTPETAAWQRSLPAFASSDPQRTATFLMAPLELLRVPLPDAVSGRPTQLAHVQRSKTLLRFGVAALLVLAAILVGSSLMRRGLSAADQASAILAQAREREGEPAREERSRARLQVVLLVIAVALAFLAGALLIVAKPLWF